MKLELTNKDLEEIRWFIIENIMHEPDVMFSDYRVCQIETGAIDLIEVIASLYEVLHQIVTGEPYRYMFHHANKIGAWVQDDLFDACTLEGKGEI